MTKKELAIEIMKHFKYHPDAIHAFKQDDKVMMSIDRMGFLYDADKEQAQQIKKLEETGNLCYAIIKGTYRIGEDGPFTLTDYLLVTDYMLKTAEKNLKNKKPLLMHIVEETIEPGVETAYAYSTGLCDEFGDIGVRGLSSGGLKREM